MAESNTRQTLNELLVDLFNFILYIQEKYMKEKGVPLTMYEVHLLENVSKITPPWHAPKTSTVSRNPLAGPTR